jgi:BRCA1-associated protein
MSASKLDAVTFEYNQLLMHQLESQRRYFEGLLSTQAAESAKKAEAMEGSARVAADSLGHAKEMELRAVKAERKINDLTARLARLEEEKEFLRQVNDSLIVNQKGWKVKLADADTAAQAKHTQLEEMEEQLRDLMVYIEAQKMIESSSELRDGSVVSVATPSPLRKNRKGKGKA